MRVRPDTEIRPLLPTIRVPTLVLNGEVDRNVPVEAGRYLAEHISGARFHAFKGRGHSLLATAAAELAQVVRSFILRRSPETPGFARQK